MGKYVLLLLVVVIVVAHPAIDRDQQMIFTVLSDGSTPPGYLSNLTVVQRGVGGPGS